MGSRPDTGWRRLTRGMEAVGAVLTMGLFKALPLDAASALGGWVGRSLGLRHKASQRARRNLHRAYPEMPPAEVEDIVRGMWDNLGRLVAEYPHLHGIDVYGNGRIEVVGAEHIERLRDDGRPGLFFTAHLGNWEITAKPVIQRGLPLAFVYRAANNPFVDRLIQRARRDPGLELIPKGTASARRAIQILGAGGHVGLLVDQKMSNGVAVPFFGRDAMTAPALAQFALRFACPVVPTRVERLDGARFRITYYPPMEVTDSGDRNADIAAFMAQVTALIEDWVRARPEQWFWVHRRWGA